MAADPVVMGVATAIFAVIGIVFPFVFGRGENKE